MSKPWGKAPRLLWSREHPPVRGIGAPEDGACSERDPGAVWGAPTAHERTVTQLHFRPRCFRTWQEPLCRGHSHQRSVRDPLHPDPALELVQQALT